MASLAIRDRISGNSQKISLNDISIKGDGLYLKTIVSKQINVPHTDIELVYCGQCLRDDKPIDDYGVQNGSTIYALKKQPPLESVTPGPVRDADIRQMKTTLRKALINPAYRTVVERVLSDPQEIERLIAGTPGLDLDPVTLAMLHDGELLAILINPTNINSVLEGHPSLAKAALLISETVSEEESRTGPAGTSTTGTYSLDQMSDDEDSITPAQSGSGGQAITASQLAAALSAATGSLSSPGSSQQNDTPSRITSDFFQQALLQAQGAHAAPPDESTIQSQLEQLRDMGIGDEDVARRALQASGGDIQMALNLIFGDGNI